MIRLALWVASAIFLALVGRFVICMVGGALLGIIGSIFEPASGSPIKYSPPVDENAERKAQVFAELKAKAGPRKDGESLQEYGQRLGIVRL